MAMLYAGFYTYRVHPLCHWVNLYRPHIRLTAILRSFSILPYKSVADGMTFFLARRKGFEPLTFWSVAIEIGVFICS